MTNLPNFEDLIPEEQSLPSFENLQSETPSKTESAIRGGAQGLTLGHADEITAALEKLTTNKPYSQAVEESRANYAAAKEANPIAYGASEIAGSIAPYTAASIATGSPIGGAALAGALQGEGESAAPLASKETALNTAIGGGIGAAGGAIGEVAGKILNPESIETVARNVRLKSFNVPSTALDEPGELARMAKSTALLKEKGVAPKLFESTEKATERLKDFAKDPGAIIEQIPTYLDQNEAAPKGLIRDIHKQVAETLIPHQLEGAYAPEVKVSREVLDTITAHDDSYLSVLKLKQKLQNLSKFNSYNPGDPEAPLKVKAYQKASRMVRNMLQDKIDEVAPELGTSFAEANKVYGAAKDVLPAMEKQTAKNAVGSVANFNLEKPLEMAKTPVTRVTSWGADKLLNLVKNTPEKLGKFAQPFLNALKTSPASVTATSYVLQQRDPEYSQMLQSIQENEGK